MDMPDNPADSPPDWQADRGDGARWMTFSELAKVRGISKLSAARLVRRHGWRRQQDNQGHVIALVPSIWVNPADNPPASPRDDPPDDLSDKATRPADNPPDAASLVAALAAVESAHIRAENALRERAEAAEGRAEAAESRAEAERERADAAIAAERRRAVEAEEALAFERVRVESLQRDVAAHLSMATEAAHGFEAVRQRAAEAERAADALRQTEAARKGRGRLARLRAAWRGE